MSTPTLDRQARSKKIRKIRYFYKIFSNLFSIFATEKIYNEYETGHDCNS